MENRIILQHGYSGGRIIDISEKSSQDRYIKVRQWLFDKTDHQVGYSIF